MDHQDQHHEKHRHQREEKKEERKEHEHQEEKHGLPIHPAWLLVGGVVLVVAAMIIWTFFVW